MRIPLSLVLLAACSKSSPPPPSKPITAKTGPVALLTADGSPMLPFTIAEYEKQFASSTAVVVARTFPEGLSALAGAGVNMHAQGKNVSYVIDGNPAAGFALAFDENVNGDLRDDPKRPFTKVGDAWELSLTMTTESPWGQLIEFPARLRMRGTDFTIQDRIERRGTLALPKGPMAFALVGEAGQFGLDHHYIAFDLDRDTKLDVTTLDNPELFHVFEKHVTIDDVTWAFELTPDGSQLTLRPLKTKLPARAPLAVGTPAPDIRVTDLDGKPASLSALRGKVVLVDFWSTSCGPCVRALPRLADMRAKHVAQGFEFMGIAETSDDVRETLGAHRTGIEAIDDAAHALYRVDRYPMYFLIGRDGNILCSRCQLDKIESMLATALAR